MWQTASYSNTTDNFEVEKSAWKSAQNLRKWCAEFATYAHRIIVFFWQRILTTLVTIVYYVEMANMSEHSNFYLFSLTRTSARGTGMKMSYFSHICHHHHHHHHKRRDYRGV